MRLPNRPAWAKPTVVVAPLLLPKKYAGEIMAHEIILRYSTDSDQLPQIDCRLARFLGSDKPYAAVLKAARMEAMARGVKPPVFEQLPTNKACYTYGQIPLGFIYDDQRDDHIRYTIYPKNGQFLSVKQGREPFVHETWYSPDLRSAWARMEQIRCIAT